MSPKTSLLHNLQIWGPNVPRMVFVEVYSVMMLTTGKTSTTWMLAMLSYTTVTGGHMAAAKNLN